MGDPNGIISRLGVDPYFTLDNANADDVPINDEDQLGPIE